MHEFVAHESMALRSRAQRLARFRKPLAAILLLLAFSLEASAQGTISALEGVKTWVNNIVNVVFIMVIIYAALMAIIKFVRSDQGAWGYAFTVLIALLFWGGFNTYKEDIFTLMGGANAISVE